MLDVANRNIERGSLPSHRMATQNQRVCSYLRRNQKRCLIRYFTHSRPTDQNVHAERYGNVSPAHISPRPGGKKELGHDLCGYVQRVHTLLAQRGVFSPRVMEFLEVWGLRVLDAVGQLRNWVPTYLSLSVSRNESLRGAHQLAGKYRRTSASNSALIWCSSRTLESPKLRAGGSDESPGASSLCNRQGLSSSYKLHSFADKN